MAPDHGRAGGNRTGSRRWGDRGIVSNAVGSRVGSSESRAINQYGNIEAAEVKTAPANRLYYCLTSPW